MRESRRHEHRHGRHGCGHDRGSRHSRDHEHGGRRRRGRLLGHGDLRFVILAFLEETPRHGYEVIKAIEEATGGAYSPSAGAMYPTLTLLEEMGWTEAAGEEGGRKRYAITDEGRAALASRRAMVDEIFARMAEVKADQGGRPPAELLEAFDALKATLNAKAGHGGLAPEQTGAVLAALEEATRKIAEA